MLYARPKKNCLDESKWQPLDAHLSGVAEIAATGGATFEAAEIARIAGLLHDLGKADVEFQKYLAKSAALGPDSNEKLRCAVNHSEAGAAFAVERFGPFWGTTLAYLIAGHHAGLADYRSNQTGNAALTRRLQSGKANLERIGATLKPLLAKFGPTFDKLKNGEIAPPRFQNVGDYHLWVRFLFSALVDADRLDSEAFDAPETTAARGKFASIPELKARFDRHMAAKFGGSAADVPQVDEQAATLKRLRDDVLAACREAGREAVDVSRFTLTVPTGGGKTLASMAFALERAVALNLDRIIYAIPYTSIIEQTANTFREIFGAENVVEHHSNFDVEKLGRKNADGKARDSSSEDSNDDADDERSDPKTAKLRRKFERAAENWDAPIILTTNVQLFESLYSAKPSRCRKLWRVARSVVILDEAQLIKPELLSPCVDVLNRLSDSYRTTILLSTATRSADALGKLGEIGAVEVGKGRPASFGASREIARNPEELYRELARVRYEFDEPDEKRSWEEIADELERYDEVLCVVNTRRDCRELFDVLNDRDKKRRERREALDVDAEGNAPPETVHLSALMCGAHRSETIRTIRELLDANRTAATKRPLRVVSTQLVEAGVDVDFPVVFRAFAGLDSIVQAAGRCNREGRLGKEGGLVRVFAPPTVSPAGLLRKGEEATRSMFRRAAISPNDPATFDKYFRAFYGKLNDLDECDALRRLSVNVTGAEFDVPFRSVGEDFKLIDDETSRTVFVRYGEGGDAIDLLRKIGPKRDVMRKLQRYSVSVPLNALFRLCGEGKVEEIWPGIFAQNAPNLYDDVFGLALFEKGVSAALLNA